MTQKMPAQKELSEERLNEIRALFTKALTSERIMGWGGSATAVERYEAGIALCDHIDATKPPAGGVAEGEDVARVRMGLSNAAEFLEGSGTIFPVLDEAEDLLTKLSRERDEAVREAERLDTLSAHVIGQRNDVRRQLTSAESQLAAARESALEEAAKIAENWVGAKGQIGPLHNMGMSTAAEAITKRIRALAKAPQ